MSRVFNAYLYVFFSFALFLKICYNETYREKMKPRLLFFLVSILFVPNTMFGACSVANLTRCLDSACAINIGANPAARCQYCGVSSAGEPSKSTAMKSISAGASAKYNISDKELKKAPKDPGERYVWATEQCLKKVSGCTPDDVTDNYDKLIEQSCTAAGISAQMASLSKKVNTAKTKTSCSNEISACIISDKHCLADYTKCKTDSEFDKMFSDCSIASVGCDSFLADIRSSLITTRDTTIKNADRILQMIVSAYQNARSERLALAQQSCKDDSEKQSCISRVCNHNMRYKCDESHEYEITLANELCKFYDIACTRLK